MLIPSGARSEWPDVLMSDILMYSPLAVLFGFSFDRSKMKIGFVLSRFNYFCYYSFFGMFFFCKLFTGYVVMGIKHSTYEMCDNLLFEYVL